MSKKLLFLACAAALAVVLTGCEIKGANIYQISFNAVASAKPDAAIDSNGDLHAVYDRDGSVYYKKNRGIEQLAAAGTDASVAVGSDNIPQVVYLDSGSVKFTKLNGAWTAPETLGAGDWATIDVDSLNNAYVAFSALGTDGRSDIIYATNASGGFVSALVLDGKFDVVNDLDDQGLPYTYTTNYSYIKPVIKLNSNGNYYIAYINTSDDGEDIGVKSDLASADFTSGTGGDFSKNALVLDSSGNALIVAGDKTSSSITRIMIDYANTNGGISTVGTVYSDGPIDNPTGAVIVANEANEEVVASNSVSGIKSFAKNADSGFNLVDSGNEYIDSSNPVVILGAGSFYVYYEKSGNIWLATDQSIADSNPPVVSGVIEGGLYNTSKTITFTDDESVPTATLDGAAFASGDTASAGGAHILVVTDGTNSATVNFTIDTVAPVITGVSDGSTYTSAIAGIDFSDGAGSGIATATLNGGAFASGAGVSTNGAYTLIVTDNAGNAATVAFTIDIPVPVTPPTPSTGGGGGGGGGPAPTIPSATSISINTGAAQTETANVTLTLGATNASTMLISNKPDFSDATAWLTYAATKAWTLTSGAGVKTVYVKFRSSNGGESAAINDTILFTAGASTTLTPKILGAAYTDVTAEEQALITKIDNKLVRRLAGRILLQVQRFGQAWYLDPLSLKKYYLADGQQAYQALRKFGLGISNADLAKIPVGYESRFIMTDSDNDGLADKIEEALGTNPLIADTDGDGVNDGNEVLKQGTNPLGSGKLITLKTLVDRLKGRILIQVESRGEAWYVNPVDGKRYYMNNGEAAYQIMRFLSLGITDSDIHKIPVGSF